MAPFFVCGDKKQIIITVRFYIPWTYTRKEKSVIFKLMDIY